MSDTLFPLDLASVDHVLNTTRSVRLRLDLEREVPRELIEQALTIALQAPTGANTCANSTPWSSSGRNALGRRTNSTPISTISTTNTAR